MGLLQRLGLPDQRSGQPSDDEQKAPPAREESRPAANEEGGSAVNRSPSSSAQTELRQDSLLQGSGPEPAAVPPAIDQRAADRSRSVAPTAAAEAQATPTPQAPPAPA